MSNDERPLMARIKAFLRPMKARAKAKAETLAVQFVAAAARDESGVVPFRGALARTLIQQRPARKDKAAPKAVKGD